MMEDQMSTALMMLALAIFNQTFHQLELGQLWVEMDSVLEVKRNLKSKWFLKTYLIFDNNILYKVNSSMIAEEEKLLFQVKFAHHAEME